jgi:hypothetical protein
MVSDQPRIDPRYALRNIILQDVTPIFVYGGRRRGFVNSLLEEGLAYANDEW